MCVYTILGFNYLPSLLYLGFRSTLTTGLERNVEVTFDKLYDEITSPSHIAKIRLGFKNKDKYRRPFEEEVSGVILM